MDRMQIDGMKALYCSSVVWKFNFDRQEIRNIIDTYIVNISDNYVDSSINLSRKISPVKACFSRLSSFRSDNWPAYSVLHFIPLSILQVGISILVL